MSEVIKDRHNKETTLAERVVNSNTLTTALTCAICMVIFAVCLRPTSDGGGGGGYDPSDMVVKKLAKMEERIEALSKALKEADQKYVNGRYIHSEINASYFEYLNGQLLGLRV